MTRVSGALVPLVPNQDRDIKIGTNIPISKFIFNNFFFLPVFHRW